MQVSESDKEAGVLGLHAATQPIALLFLQWDDRRLNAVAKLRSKNPHAATNISAPTNAMMIEFEKDQSARFANPGGLFCERLVLVSIWFPPPPPSPTLK